MTTGPYQRDSALVLHLNLLRLIRIVLPLPQPAVPHSFVPFIPSTNLLSLSSSQRPRNQLPSSAQAGLELWSFKTGMNVPAVTISPHPLS